MTLKVLETASTFNNKHIQASLDDIQRCLDDDNIKQICIVVEKKDGNLYTSHMSMSKLSYLGLLEWAKYETLLSIAK